MRWWTPWLLVLVGCAKPATDPPAASPTVIAGDAPVATRGGAITPTSPPSTPAPDPGAARWASLSARLRARHTADLPDHDALAAIPDAADGLAWIAAHDPALVVRARALDAIGVLGATDAAPVLAAALADGAAHPKLRAAAAIGLGRIVDRPAAQAALLAVVPDRDVVVATTAVDALATEPSARPALTALGDRTDVDPTVRARIAALR